VTRAARAQGGLVRGCCALLVVALVVLGAIAFIADRALAAPDLGAAPRGPDHGDSQTAIAVSLGSQLVLALIAQPHAVLTLSEHDLTVLAAAHPPSGVTGLTARVRNGLVVVSGQHPFGPFTVNPVAHVSVALDVNQAPPSLSSRVDQLDIGQLGLPGFIKDRILGSFASSINLDQLFKGSPALQALRANLECVAISPDGLLVGVHRPGFAPDTTVCAS
jgi:hypothetical protein